VRIKLFIVAGVMLSVLFIVWGYGNSVIQVGESESRWIRVEMWKPKYFNTHLGGLEDFEKVNLLSLRDGASKEQAILTYVVKNGCKDSLERCSVIMISAANLLIDAGEFDAGLKGAVEANERVKGLGICPIAFESAVLKYKLKYISSKGISSARRSASSLLSKIRQNGGVVENLRVGSCDSLAEIKPEFFHEYVLLISHLMGLAGGDFAKAGAYIQSSVN